MIASTTALPDVILLEPKVYGDDRGFFMETWNQKRYSALGIAEQFVQDNLSFSYKGVVRGLHFQHPHAQGKLVQVLQGEVFDVAVDIRVGSPHFGQWVGVVLSSENRRQLYVPPGFAHGFSVSSDSALFSYKCTADYSPQDEGCLLWNDPGIGVEWPNRQAHLSDKDSAGMALVDYPRERLPKFTRE